MVYLLNIKVTSVTISLTGLMYNNNPKIREELTSITILEIVNTTTARA